MTKIVQSYVLVREPDPPKMESVGPERYTFVSYMDRSRNMSRLWESKILRKILLPLDVTAKNVTAPQYRKTELLFASLDVSLTCVD